MKTHRNRVRFAAAAAALLCTGVMPAGAFVPVESSVFGSDSYAAYASAGHTGKSPASPLSLNMREPAASEKAETLEELNGYSGPSLKLAEGGFAEWSFNFPEDTLCHVEISCCQVTGRGANAEFALYINGEIPFSSAAGLRCGAYTRMTWREALFSRTARETTLSLPCGNIRFGRISG